MQTNCLNCGIPFRARRTTKKYCSHNCKQLAYFKRNGMIFGINGSPAENLQPLTVKDDNSDSVKYDSLIEKPIGKENVFSDTIKSEPEIKVGDELIVKQMDSVKDTDNVKYGTAVKDVNEKLTDIEKELTHLLSEKQTEQLIASISSLLENKIQQKINDVKEELSVKYDSLYAKNNLAQNTVSETETEVLSNVKCDKEKFNAKDDHITEPEEKLYALQCETNLSENTPRTTEEKIQISEPEQKYEWITSKFYENIEAYNEKTEGGFDFRNNEDMNWVNPRLRCVIENVIRLSEFAFIDRESVLKLSNTLDAILTSRSFQSIHDHYLFTETISELSQRLNALSETKNQNVPLRIGFNLKAKLVSIQNQFKENVPLLRFNEINFAEPHRGIFLNQHQTNNQNKKRISWKERCKQYVEAGLIEPDEDGNN